MDFSPEQIRSTLIYLFVLLISVALHEFGHAFVADKLGDDTPRRQGRVTLNPLAHADPIGTLLLPVLGSLNSGGAGGGFGWGRPVQWQPHRISRRWSTATAKILVSIAGPAMNLLLGTLAALVHVALISQHVVGNSSSSGLGMFLRVAAFTNIGLFFFNLLPLPPLDGGHIAESFTPYRYRAQFEKFARYAPYVVLGLMIIPQVQHVLAWPATQVTIHLYEGFGRLFGIF